MNRQFSMQSRSSSCFSLHHLRIMLISLLMMTEICHGFLWLSKSNSLKTLGTAHSDIHNDVAKILSEKEIESLRLNYDALQSYSRKPDCFKRAAGLVRAQCIDLDMDEDARVEAAITMTLCEVATAKHHSFPLECSPYLYDASSQSGRASVSSKVQGECVDSLARSAQFWSSYSGYLREVPQLCYAFRRWNDIDLAKDIYHNATVEKIALIRFLVNREKMISKHTDRWTEMSSEMGQLVGQFELLSQKYHSNVDDFALLLKDEVDNTLRSFRSMLHDIFSRQEKANIQSASLVQCSFQHREISNIGNSFRCH
ncbi:hypothetical protein BDN70DRAFT_223506 [Pholiota conissans]|uniref:Uncharacterized protein n=1 Tax=Pholiota conissans TaxID=109636 RepID=A0A9P5YXL8_9AGAR|nr:hypothetical protein BDN70DRAFT_223506 [Pholiota conissans]